MVAILVKWARASVPTRESMARSRMAGPLARRAELWRFNRRSVPRAVALGLFVGIFLMVPGLQVIAAALLCVPLRANVPLAAASTFVATPPTILFLFLPGAAWIGDRLGFHANLGTIEVMMARGASLNDWLAWLGSEAAPALALGLGLMGLVAAVAGYAVTALVWRWRTGRKWRQRLDRTTGGGA